MSDETETGLPASFELAWGVRDRPTKGPKRGLSLEQVVDAGIHVANVEGIGGVSMSRVAKELGASAMSLYRYVASKDELLALMIDGAFGKVELSAPAEGTWRDRLTWWAEVELLGYRRFPWILRIQVSAPPIMPNQLWFMEQGLRGLAGTGLKEEEKLSVILLVTSFTRSFATLNQDLTEAAGGEPTIANVMPRYGEMIKRLTSAAEYPALHAVVDAGTFDIEADLDDPDYDFRFGLERLLDGIEVLIRRRG